MEALLRKRYVFVTGKGGVGKSTVAGALGLLAAAAGRRAIVVELHGRARLPAVFGVETDDGDGDPTAERELAPGLWSTTVDPQIALLDYLRDQLPVAAMADQLGRSRTFGHLAAATPGLPELLALGRIWDLGQPQRRTRGTGSFDLVIVDAPATGHGVAMLAAPRTFSRIARVGPVARHGRVIADTLRDRDQTAVVGVAVPEETPVGELLELDGVLPGDLGHGLDLAVLNQHREPRLDDAVAAATERLHDAAPVGSPRRAVLAAALQHEHRARHAGEQLKRLRAGLPDATPVTTLPRLVADRLEARDLAALSEALAR